MTTYVSILDFSNSEVRVLQLSDQQSRDYHEILEDDGEALMIHLGYNLDNIAFMITDEPPLLSTNMTLKAD